MKLPKWTKKFIVPFFALFVVAKYDKLGLVLPNERQKCFWSKSHLLSSVAEAEQGRNKMMGVQKQK